MQQTPPAQPAPPARQPQACPLTRPARLRLPGPRRPSAQPTRALRAARSLPGRTQAIGAGRVPRAEAVPTAPAAAPNLADRFVRMATRDPRTQRTRGQRRQQAAPRPQPLSRQQAPGQGQARGQRRPEPAMQDLPPQPNRVRRAGARRGGAPGGGPGAGNAAAHSRQVAGGRCVHVRLRSARADEAKLRSELALSSTSRFGGQAGTQER
jgi:hypothetical protein